LHIYAIQTCGKKENKYIRYDGELGSETTPPMKKVKKLSKITPIPEFLLVGNTATHNITEPKKVSP
jgi:hypothetical protein